MVAIAISPPPAIFLMGPTASGKTDLAMAISQQLPCEIISVDSALIYRDMDIGTAKPSAAELAQAPHRLINIRDPAESYSVAEFRRDALTEMAAITAAGKIPLLVGGTMLYFKALLEGLAATPETDLQVRAQLEREAEQHGWPYLHAQLAEVDPDSAARIHPNHSQRIERALCIYRMTGVSMTEYHFQQAQNSSLGQAELPYDVLQMAIAPLDRTVLHRRIEKRFRQMVEQGLVDEVRALHQRSDLHVDLPSMRCVGYRQAWEYLEGGLSYEEMIERGIIATRQLAKRQFTWLKRWQDLHWLHTDEFGCLLASEQSLPAVDGLQGQSVQALALKYLDRFAI